MVCSLSNIVGLIFGIVRLFLSIVVWSLFTVFTVELSVLIRPVFFLFGAFVVSCMEPWLYS